MNPYEERLVDTMLSLSNDNIDWEAAKLEWHLTKVEEGYGNCICGKNSIKYLCYLTNSQNGKEVIVGSSCADKYLDIHTSLLFKDIAILLKERKGYLSEQSLSYAYKNYYITLWEYDFYNNLKEKWKLSKLTEKQLEIYARIHTKVSKLINKFNSL